MLRRNLSFAIILLIIQFLPSHAISQSTESFKDIVKKASSFDDIFKDAEIIKLEPPHEALIQVINQIIPIGDDFVLLIHGKGIYKILVYGEDGIFKNYIGETGYDIEDFYTPSSIAANKNDHIMIYDPPNNKINIFTINNIYKGTLKLAKPGSNIKLNSKGEIFLSTLSEKVDNNDLIIKHTPEGKKVCEFASLDKALFETNQFLYSNLFCIDRNDFIYEVNPFWSYIRKYNSLGRLISEFGSKTIKMNKIVNYDGKEILFPRCVKDFFVVRDLLFIVYDDRKCDVYDVEGESVKQDLDFSHNVLFASDKEIISHSEGDPLLIIKKYIPRG